jgi:hypothetical protein
MKDHGIYPSVGNMKAIDEAFGVTRKLGFDPGSAAGSESNAD